MDKKFRLKEIIVPLKDNKFEHFRTAKTFCLIMIIFCLGLIFRSWYYDMLDNSRFLKFYPKTTVFYQDFSQIGGFEKLKLDKKFQSFSYGIFKDDRGKDKFLAVAKTPDEDTPIIDTVEYSMFTKGGYVFLSDSPKELENLMYRIAHEKFDLLQDANLKKLIKNLDKKRDYTILINDVNYLNIPMDEEIRLLLGKIFDKTLIQIYEIDDGIKIKGEIAFKNKVAGIAANAKRIAECFSFRKIRIEKFQKNSPSLIIGVKDFDLWSKTILQLTKTIPDNQYIKTLNLIQNGFHSDIEADIVQKLNGNAVVYLFEEKEVLHPMLILETKKNLVHQVRKYFGFLQLHNNSTLTEKEVGDTTFSVLSSGVYPYNLSFVNLDDKLFAFGHQNIIENYVENNTTDYLNQSGDFYLYADISELPSLRDNYGFWSDYEKIELKLSLAPDVKFDGCMLKKD